MKLQFNKDGNSTNEDYGDADWANEVDDGRSISGNTFMFQRGLSWQSKKQSTTALFTTETEYIRGLIVHLRLFGFNTWRVKSTQIQQISE